MPVKALHSLFVFVCFFPLLIITWILVTVSEVLKHWNINAETIKKQKKNKLSDYWFPYMDAEPQPFKTVTIGRLNPLGYQMGPQ